MYRRANGLLADRCTLCVTLGALSHVTMCLFSALLVQRRLAHATGNVQAARHIAKHEGFTGFYKGNGANVRCECDQSCTLSTTRAVV